MALLFMEGFEAYADNADLNEDTRCIQVTGNEVPTSTGARIDGQCLSCIGTTSYVEYIFPNSTDTYYMGFAMYVTENPSTTYEFLETRYGNGNEASIQNQLWFGSDRTIRLTRNPNITLGQTSTPIILNAWNYIVFKVYLHDTLGTAELWLNGVKEIDVTSVDTASSSSNLYVDSFLIFSYFYDCKLDDIYVGDDSGTDMTDQVGEVHIEMLTPNANGTTNDFTPITSAASNYEEVDDGAGGDGDTTYVSSTTPTDKELYGTSAISGNVGTIHAVQTQAVLRKSDVGVRSFNQVVRSDTSETDGPEIGLTETYARYNEIVETDPNTGLAWTESGVNACEVGIEVVS